MSCDKEQKRNLYLTCNVNTNVNNLTCIIFFIHYGVKFVNAANLKRRENLIGSLHDVSELEPLFIEEKVESSP